MKFFSMVLVCCCFFGALHAINDFKNESNPERIQLIATDHREANTLFKKLSNITSKIQKSCHVAENNATLNRSSFYPYDENRTCREIKDFYISASDIETPHQKYIIAQAPIPKTVNNFWKMILYKKCRLIVSACMPVESGQDRCTLFWSKPFLPKSLMGWELKLLHEQVLYRGRCSQKIVARYFQAFHIGQFKVREIVQLHLENWPDYGTPEHQIFQVFLDLVDVLATDPKVPILVHCSAGIGRSGTFVAAHSLRKDILAGDDRINIPERVYELRLQRRDLVTTTKQFQFIYKSLLH